MYKVINIDFLVQPKYSTDRHVNKFIHNEDNKLNSYNGSPAVITKQNVKFWYKNGLQHREGGLPAVVYLTGHKEYFVQGNFIRLEQP